MLQGDKPSTNFLQHAERQRECKERKLESVARVCIGGLSHRLDDRAGRCRTPERQGMGLWDPAAHDWKLEAGHIVPSSRHAPRQRHFPAIFGKDAPGRAFQTRISNANWSRW